jgi:hypothetical protein
LHWVVHLSCYWNVDAKFRSPFFIEKLCISMFNNKSIITFWIYYRYA